MSQYAVLYNEKSRTFTIKDEGKEKPNEKAFSHLSADKLGEMSEAVVKPMPAEHLKNLADGLGLDIKTFTIKNASSNERLDVLEQTPAEITDADRTVAVYTGEEAKDADGKDKVNPADVEMRAPSEV